MRNPYLLVNGSGNESSLSPVASASIFIFFHFCLTVPENKMASSAIALLLSGGFEDDAEPNISSSSSFPPALRGIGGGPCSLERWLSLPSLPPQVLLVVAAGAGERRARSFLELKKRLFPALSIEVVVVPREDEVKQLAAAAESAALPLSSSHYSSLLVVADAAAVPLGLDLARLRAAASLLSAPSVVVSSSPLDRSKGSSSGGGEALQKTCKGLGKVSLLGRGSSVARVAAFFGAGSNDSDNNSDGHDDGEIFDAQRVVFLPASSLESAARHPGSVRSWLRAQGPNLRALVSSTSASASPSPLSSPGSGDGSGPLPHASTAAGRALAATLLSRGGKWSATLPASGAEAWLAALVASASASAAEDFEFEGEEEERERRPEKSSEGLSPPLPKNQHASFSTTSSAYGAAAPPAAAAAASRRLPGGGGSSSASSSTLPLSSAALASPRKLSVLLPPLSPVLKTGSSGAAGGTLRFDIPRSRVHDKLDA